MRASRPWTLVVLFLFVAHTLSAGFLPTRRTPKRPPKQGGAAILQRGPSYSPASVGTFSPEEVQQQIDASKPGVNDIAVQAVGLGGGGNCDTSSINRLAAITAEANAILVQLNAARAALAGCGLNVSCATTWGNRAIVLGNQATALANEALALQGAVAAAQACLAKGGGGGGVGLKANPPGLTYTNFAKRLGVPLGGPGPAGATVGSSVLERLQDDVEHGRIPDYDGRGARPAKALSAYQRSLRATAQLAPKLEAGRKLAGKPARDFDDPRAAAEHEYLRINYEVLGPKYAALAKERSERADAFADQALAAETPLPLPSEQPPSIVAEAGKAFAEGLQGLGQDPHVQAMAEQVKSDLGEKFEELLQQMGVKKELISIVKIQAAVGEQRHLTDDLHAAIGELGSLSRSTEKQEALLGKLDAYFDHVQEVTQDEVKAWFGGEDD